MASQVDAFFRKTLREAIQKFTVALKQQSICSTEEAQREAGLVAGEALGLDPLGIFKNLEKSLSDFPESSLSRFRDFQKRRLKGEPLSRIRGTRPFWKETFFLSEATLDPRPETEGLIELALSFFQGKSLPRTIVDLGTGTGCLLLSLLQEFPEASGIGVDRSQEALKIARKNSFTLNMEERCSFVETDWMEGLEGPFDLIVSNPPYIPSIEIASLAPEVRCFDPLLALDGGVDGLEAYRRLIPQAAKHLSARGVFLFEIGEGQEKFLSPFLSVFFERTNFFTDLSRIIRYGQGEHPL